MNISSSSKIINSFLDEFCLELDCTTVNFKLNKKKVSKSTFKLIISSIYDRFFIDDKEIFIDEK